MVKPQLFLGGVVPLSTGGNISTVSNFKCLTLGPRRQLACDSTELWNTSVLWIALWKNPSLSLDNKENEFLIQVLRIVYHSSILIICQPGHIIFWQ